MKTLIAVIGIYFISIISVAGCGDVVAVDADAGVAGAAGVTGAAGATATPPDAGHDALAMMEHPADVIVTPRRALGAGCSLDEQCGSGICVVAETGMCCDGRPKDACSACVGGYVTPLHDGSLCGPGSGPPYSCQSGMCLPNP